MTEATLETTGGLTMETEPLAATAEVGATVTAEVGTTVTADEAELAALVAGGAWIWPSEI